MLIIIELFLHLLKIYRIVRRPFEKISREIYRRAVSPWKQPVRDEREGERKEKGGRKEGKTEGRKEGRKTPKFRRRPANDFSSRRVARCIAAATRRDTMRRNARRRCRAFTVENAAPQRDIHDSV